MNAVLPEPPPASTLSDQVPTDLFIGGRWRPAEAGATFVVENPATGEALAQVADASARGGLDALAAADAAQPSWAATPPRSRAEILRRAHDLLRERAEPFALLITQEMGKSLAESRSEVTYAAGYLRGFAEEAVRIDGGWKTSEDGSARVLVMRQPSGPAC